jgi:hypothetical protein
MRNRGLLFVFCIAALTVGCAPRNRTIEPALPEYPWQGPAYALRRLATLDRAVNTVTAQLTMVMPHRGGRTRLDAILVAEAPRRMRCRAYKAGRTAFDMTIDEVGYRLIAGPEGERLEGRWADEAAHLAGGVPAEAPMIDPRWFRPVLAQLGGRGDGDEPIVLGESKAWFEVAAMVDGARVVRRIAKRTLLDQRMTVYDKEGPAVTIALDEYALIGDHPWPMSTSVQGRAPDQWCRLRFRSVKLNEPLAPAAFDDPRS